MRKYTVAKSDQHNADHYSFVMITNTRTNKTVYKPAHAFMYSHLNYDEPDYPNYVFNAVFDLFR